jgi:hypothetical protein
MIRKYGIRPLHDAAVAANSLKRAISDLGEMADQGDFRDVVGLTTVGDLAKVLADAVDRQWHVTRPTLEEKE